MFQIDRLLQLLRRTLLTFVLAGLISLIALPTISAYALPFLDNSTSNSSNANKAAELEKVGNRPYDEGDNVNIIETDKSYLNSAEKAAKAIPKDLGNNDKDTGHRVNRAINELGNDQLQRAFGADDYKRSEAEQGIAR